MADLSIKLKTQADSVSFNSSIKKLEAQASPIKLRIEATTGVSGLLDKSAKESAAIFEQFRKASVAAEDFQVKLNNLKTIGESTQQQFDNFSDKLSGLKKNLKSGEITLEGFSDGMHDLKNEVSEASTSTKAMGQSILDIVGKFTKWYLISGIVTGTINALKQMVSEVISLDASMVELNKVFDASSEELEKVKDRAFELADGLGTTGKAVIDATTEFKRMGYTIDESLDLARVATMMTNVAEGITDAGEAANILTAILKGTGVSTEYAMSLLDRLNEVSNNNAISFDALARMLQESAASMSVLGNNIDETIGMLTGAYAVIQDEKVGKALTTIGLRIAGLNEDLEEEAGLANDVSKALQKYAGINVFDEQTGQIRSTYEIMKDLAGVWDDLNKNEQTMLLNVLAGKQRADVAAAMLTNWEEVDKAIQDASNSMGSAAKEQEAYLNSIEGKIQSFKNVFQELADTIIDSDIIKGFIDIGTGILKVIRWVTQLIEKLGGLKTIILTLTSVMLIFKAQAIAGIIASVFNFIKTIPALIAKFVAWTAATWAQFTAQMALKNALTMGVAAVGIIAGITAVTVAVSSLTNSTNDATESAEDMNDEYKDLSETFKNSKNEVLDYDKALYKLKKSLKELNTTNKETLSNLKEQNEKIKEQKDLNDKLLAVEKARQELAEAKNKRVQVFRAGIGFTYETDVSEVQSAQENLQEALDSLSEYKYDLVYDRAKEFVEKLNELLTNGDIVEGWDSLFTEFSDLLDSQFSGYLTEAQKFVDEYNKTLEKLNAISPETKVEANEAYARLEYEISQRREDLSKKQNILQENEHLYKRSKYGDWEGTAMGLGIIENYERIQREAEAIQKEITEMTQRLGGMPHYAQGTTCHKGGPAIINEKGPELVNLPRGTEVLPHDKTLKLFSMMNNPNQFLSKTGKNITLQFNGPLEFPNVTSAEDASGFIDAVISVGNSRVPKYS